MSAPLATLTTARPGTGPETAALLRLRPVVYATPTGQGLHVRGWSSSFTVTGGAGLWRLWQALASRLVDGLPGDREPLPGLRPEVAAAVSLIMRQLHEHDMLVRVPAGWDEPDQAGAPRPEVARWLESVAADPAAAWARLRVARVTVSGACGMARAAAGALTGAGLTVAAGGRDARWVALSGSGVRVLAGCGAEVGFVLPPGHSTEAVAAALASRLSLPTTADEPPYPVAALAGGAAAHRLICALAGLPDPATEAASLTADGPAPVSYAGSAVLVVRVDPLRATYHPWLPLVEPTVESAVESAVEPAAELTAEPTVQLPVGSAVEPAAGPTGTAELDVITRKLDALGDPELGMLPAAETADLPQLPAMLALAGGHLGVATTADAARLAACLRAAEAVLSQAVPAVAVGAGPRHATGVALRRLADAAIGQLPSTGVPEPEWATAPAARRWWKALTLRFAVPARVEVRRLGPGVVHAEITHAEIRHGGERLAWAVEATPADAVALAALAATGLVQARAAGVSATGPVVATGAAPAWRPDHGPEVGWTGDAWSWPAGLAAGEPALQAELHRLLAPVGADLRPYPVDRAPAPARLVARALAATSFAAIAYTAHRTGTLR